ncbi:unnamed protein product [Cuscuta europaea]|uniref:Uncharacterized protein n=1 Tax=Cuscuta europaea TaxID=41803 RepID=A0A9P0YGB8_CUSEU|nr:unnamed protein product [Cuscuta europaea]
MVPQARATPSSSRADASKGKQIVGEDQGQKRPKAEPTGDERPPKKSRHGEGSSKAVVVLDGSDTEATSLPKPPPVTSLGKGSSDPPLSGSEDSFSDIIEFSGLGPRAESKRLFGQTASSIWCSLGLKLPRDLVARDSAVDLHECGLSTLNKAAIYFCKARFAYEAQERASAQVRCEADDLVKKAKERLHKMQHDLNAALGLAKGSTSLQETVRKQTEELQLLRAKMVAVEKSDVQLRQVGMDGAVPVFEADVSKIKEAGAIEFQKSRAYVDAVNVRVKERLAQSFGEFLAKSSDALKDGIELVSGTSAGQEFLAELADDAFAKGMIGLLAGNLPALQCYLPTPFDPESAGFNASFVEAYGEALKDKCQVKDGAPLAG